MHNTIAVVIISLNEEKDIARCIGSVHDIADEIIVVDSFSTDKTKEICRGFSKVRFIEREWEGYSNTKNYSNSLAKSDYILSLDADEALSPELTKSLKKFRKTEKPETAYTMNRLTNYCGKWIRHCGWYPDKKLRLWKKEFGQWHGDIHEEVVINDPTFIESTHLKGDLFHYSYHSINQHINQYNKFTEMVAKNDIKRGKKATMFKILVAPFWKFIRDYFIRLGILDGYYGFVICMNSAHATFVKYTKQRQFQKNNPV